MVLFKAQLLCKKLKIGLFQESAGELIQVFKVGYVHELITYNDHTYKIKCTS